jgi:hypothetical protein
MIRRLRAIPPDINGKRYESVMTMKDSDVTNFKRPSTGEL